MEHKLVRYEAVLTASSWGTSAVFGSHWLTPIDGKPQKGVVFFVSNFYCSQVVPATATNASKISSSRDTPKSAPKTVAPLARLRRDSVFPNKRLSVFPHFLFGKTKEPSEVK
jgi:hypothetical protein